MSNHKYRLLYNLKPIPEGITKEELDKLNSDLPDEEKWAACDASVFLSILYPEDGSFSMLMLPVDGRAEAAENYQLPDDQVFKCWALLAHRLSKSETLGEGQKHVCAIVHQVMVEALRQAQKIEEKQS